MEDQLGIPGLKLLFKPIFEDLEIFLKIFLPKIGTDTGDTHKSKIIW